MGTYYKRNNDRNVDLQSEERRYRSWEEDDDDSTDRKYRRKDYDRSSQGTSSSKRRERSRSPIKSTREYERFSRRDEIDDYNCDRSVQEKNRSTPDPDNHSRYGRENDYDSNSSTKKEYEFEGIKMSVNFGKPVRPLNSSEDSKSSPGGISIKLGGISQQKAQAQPTIPSISKNSKLASVFNPESDDDEEEMPPECKMRMKNVGRETPTSAGPNSFGKTKMGFCNNSFIREKKLQDEIGPKGSKDPRKTSK